MTSTSAGTAHDAISCRGITKTYRSNASSVPALVDVDFDSESGITALFGPSGSGKSTLLGILAGVERPDRGDVHLGPTRLSTLSRRRVPATPTLRFGARLPAAEPQPARLPHGPPAPGAGGPVPRSGCRPDRRPARAHRPGEQGRQPADTALGRRTTAAGLRGRRHRQSALGLGRRADGGARAVSAGLVLEVVSGLAEAWNTTFVLASHDPAVRTIASSVVTLEHGRVA